MDKVPLSSGLSLKLTSKTTHVAMKKPNGEDLLPPPRRGLVGRLRYYVLAISPVPGLSKAKWPSKVNEEPYKLRKFLICLSCDRRSPLIQFSDHCRMNKWGFSSGCIRCDPDDTFREKSDDYREYQRSYETGREWWLWDGYSVTVPSDDRVWARLLG